MPTPESIERLTDRVRAFFAGEESAVLSAEAAAEAEALHRDPPADDERAWPAARALAWLYWCRYQALPAGAAEDDLAKALSLFAIVASVDPTQVPEPVSALLNRDYEHPQVKATHAKAQLRRYLRDGDDEALDNAIALFSDAVVDTADHPDRHEIFSNFASALYLRCRRSGAGEDLDHAVTAGRAALEAAPLGHPNRPAYMSNLAAALRSRFEAADDRDDLDESVVLARAAVRIADAGDPRLTVHHANLSAALRMRSERFGDDEDLAEAALAASVAVRGSDHGGRLTEPGAAVLERFARLGDAADLDESIELLRRAAGERPGERGAAPVLELDAATVVSGLLYNRVARDGRFDPAASVRALHEAVRALRERDPAAAAPWDRFLRIGP